jgi:hypothetical protein
LIGVEGSVTPELSAAMAGSFQAVILPSKIFAATSALSVSLSTPLTLYAMAMGPVTIGRFHASEPQEAFASSASILPSFGSVLSAESEPAKSTCLAMNCLMPAPEPVGW